MSRKLHVALDWRKRKTRFKSTLVLNVSSLRCTKAVLKKIEKKSKSKWNFQFNRQTISRNRCFRQWFSTSDLFDVGLLIWTWKKKKSFVRVTKQIERKSKALENFSRSITHDVRSSWKIIVGTSQIRTNNWCFYLIWNHLKIYRF